MAATAQKTAESPSEGGPKRALLRGWALYGAFRCQVVFKIFRLLLRGMTLRHP